MILRSPLQTLCQRYGNKFDPDLLLSERHSTFRRSSPFPSFDMLLLNELLLILG